MASAAFPIDLVSFCEKLAVAVTNAGRDAGWQVTQFGSRGFNTDVIVGRLILKVTTVGTPAADGSGVAIRLSRAGYDRSLPIRRTASGDLSLFDEGGAMIDLGRFVETVGLACEQPIKTLPALPTALERLCEQVASAVVTIGQASGWRVQPFGARGFNTDVIVGATTLKLTTEGGPSPDGTGAQIRLRRSGHYEAVLTTRAGAGGGLELADAGGMPVSMDRLLEMIAEGCGVPLIKEGQFTAVVVRLCEKLSSIVVKAGQELGWKMTLFGKRGFNADCAVGPNIVKVTTEAPLASDGADAKIWIRKPGFERGFSHRLGRDGELELVDDSGAVVRINRFVALLAEACNTPLVEEVPLPAAFTRLCDRLAGALVTAGNDNGWRIQLYGRSGINADVILGADIVKVSTGPKFAHDGSGATVRIARPGWERSFVTRVGQGGDLELTDSSAPVSLQRFLETVAEACKSRLKEKEFLPAPANRLCERVASTVATAADHAGWRMTPFGARGFNADLAVGANVVKVTTEGRPGPDGAGLVFRVKRPGHDRVFASRMGADGELEMTDDSGSLVTFERFAHVLTEAGKF